MISLPNLAFEYEIEEHQNRPIEEWWKVKYKPVSRPPKDFGQEAIETAKYIQGCTNKPIVLALSGGIDSEAVALSFLEAGIPFSVATIRFKDGLNAHDILYMERFCELHKIQQTFLSLDAKLFFTQGYKKYMYQGYRAVNVFRYLQILLLDVIENKLNSTAVLAGGEQRYTVNNNHLCQFYDPSVLNVTDWMQANNTLHFPYFFHTTPEMVASYIQEDLMQYLLHHPEYYNDHFITSLTSVEKMIVYRKYFRSMETREKFSGFEKIQDERLMAQQFLKARFPEMGRIYKSFQEAKNELNIL